MENRVWLLFSKKLAGEISAQEAAELNDWLSANPDLHDQMQLVEAFWQNKPVHSGNADDFARLVKRMQDTGADFYTNSEAIMESEVPVAEIGSRRKNWYYLAAAAAAVLFFVIWLLPSGDATDSPKDDMADATRTNQVSTRPGSRTKIVLPDGTQVWLNADSRLTYGNDFGKGGIREVALSGEAYFDVVSNKRNPFIITTSKIRIKVTGTAFNVRSYPNEAKSETSLIRGKVEVTSNDAPEKTYYLRPREKLILADAVLGKNLGPAKMDARVVIPKAVPVLAKIAYNAVDSIPVEAAWVSNRLAFADESFREVADKMERWFGISITIAAPELESVHFTGSFDTETLQQALEALRITTRFNYKINGNQILISKSTK